MPKTILLVEDSHDDAEFFKRKLREAGVTSRVHTLSTGRDVIDYLDGIGVYADRQMFPWPNVLFLDLAMPGMDGWKILQWLHERPPMLEKLIVIVLTGAFDVERWHEAYRLGAKTFLTKPLSIRELQNLISHWPSAWDLRNGEPPKQSAS